MSKYKLINELTLLDINSIVKCYKGRSKFKLTSTPKSDESLDYVFTTRVEVDFDISRAPFVMYYEPLSTTKFFNAYISTADYNAWLNWRKLRELKPEEEIPEEPECNFVSLKEYSLADQQKVFSYHHGEAVFSFGEPCGSFEQQLVGLTNEKFIGVFEGGMRLYCDDCYISVENFRKVFFSPEENNTNKFTDAKDLSAAELKELINEGRTCKFTSAYSEYSYQVSSLNSVMIDSNGVEFSASGSSRWTECHVFPKALSEKIKNLGLQKENSDE